MPRILLLLPTSTYRAPDFLQAAARLGVDVKNFVEAHEGKVKVESEVGRYSRFILAMPYAPLAQEIDAEPPF